MKYSFIEHIPTNKGKLKVQYNSDITSNVQQL